MNVGFAGGWAGQGWADWSLTGEARALDARKKFEADLIEIFGPHLDQGPQMKVDYVRVFTPIQN